MPGLTGSSASTDITAPISQITQFNRASGVVTGVASDTEAALSPAFEVSSNAGQTWHGTTLTRAGANSTWSHTSAAQVGGSPAREGGR